MSKPCLQLNTPHLPARNRIVRVGIVHWSGTGHGRIVDAMTISPSFCIARKIVARTTTHKVEQYANENISTKSLWNPCLQLNAPHLPARNRIVRVGIVHWIGTGLGRIVDAKTTSPSF